MSKNGVGSNSIIVAKAGIWYTICNFAFRGMAFFTTPIFARMLSKKELGSFSNFSSWASILLVITSFDLAQSIIRSKLEHEKDIDCYVWSILSLSTLWTLLVYVIVCTHMSIFSKLFSIDQNYIHIMFLYLLSAPAFSMLITKHRAFYRYKLFAALTGIMTVSGTLLSLLLVLLMQDKLAGRIIGQYIPNIVVGFAIFIIIAARGKTIKTKYWKYACVMMIPLVPHELSLYLLSSSDKIIITRMCGSEYTAIYSIAYSAYHICTILFSSMNKAWAPWLLESLHNKNYDQIISTSKKYIGVFLCFIFGIIVLVPEIIMVLGGKRYFGAIYCLPPLISSCVFQFIFTMYVNIEFYKKKTIGVSIATMVATIVNIVLNIILIPMKPEQSHVIAAYTTLVGYMVLFVAHYLIVKHMEMDNVYDTKYIFSVLLITVLLSSVMNLLYKTHFVRYLILLVYGIAVFICAYKYKEKIMASINNRRKQ